VFWFVAAGITIAVVGFISRPLWSGGSAAAASASGRPEDVAVYKRQLAELERDVELGLIAESEAISSRHEISRRLLLADKVGTESPAGAGILSGTQRKVIAGLVIVAVPVTALLVYFVNGVPSYSDLPYAKRCPDFEREEFMNEDVRLIVDCLAVRMDQNPQAEGLGTLGRFYNSLGRHTDASQAYASALELSGPNVEYLEGLGVSVTSANQAFISEVASEAFRQANKLDPKSPTSRYYLAEFEYQNGNDIEALRQWVDLLEETEPGTPLYDIVNQRIGRGIEQSQAQSNAPVAPAELEFENEDQAAMVRSMVDGLALRLKEDPNDLEGWLRLIRSHSVLNEVEKAQAAISTATLTFLADPAALEQIIALSEELSLTSTSDLKIPLPE
jgi:cytochrome c-type biogenesis protein CcmH